MKFSEEVQHYFQINYVNPARKRGQRSIEVRAGELHRRLGWSRRVPLVCAALSSKKLQRNVGVRLTEKDGPPSGQSPTVVFHYEILDAVGGGQNSAKATTDLMDIYGIGAEVFEKLGGGEQYLRREREELQFPTEGLHRSGDNA